MNDNHDNGVDQQRRAYPRVGFSKLVKIVVPDDDTAIDVVASNVSRDGIFIKTTQPLDKGKKMTLEFDIKNEKIRVEEGEVIWTKSIDHVDESDAGMGIRFNNLSEGSRKKIESFIQEELKKKPSQADGHSVRFSLHPKPEEPAGARDVSEEFFDERLAGSFFTKKLHGSSESQGTSGPSEWGSGVTQRDSMYEYTEDPRGLGNQGGMRMTSRASPPRSRWLLFGVFVCIVAVVTFLTLYLIKPIGSHKQAKFVTSSPEDSLPVDASMQAKTDRKDSENTLPADAKPSVGVDKTAETDQKAIPNASSRPVEKSTSAADTVSKPGGDVPAPATGALGLSIQDPEFKKTSQGWQMEVRATSDVKIKHFELKSPPRLVIDFEKAEYAGKETSLESPMPAIIRVRVGEDPSHTRIVLDFKGTVIPAYRMDIQKSALRIHF